MTPATARFAHATSRIAVALALVAGAARSSGAQQATAPCHLFCLSGRAAEALNAKRHDDYLRLAREVARLARDHPGGIYAVAQGFALTSQPDSAIAWLARLADIGATHDLTTDSSFAALASDPAFGRVAARLRENASPVTRGRPAFAVPDPDLLPEALAWDATRKRWLVGSQTHHSILARSDDSTWTTFVADPRMLRVLGLHVDSARSELWFATWLPAHPQSAAGDARRRASGRLFRADLATGAIRRTYEPADTTRHHLLNDLAIAADGTVYVTDNRAGIIYRVPAIDDSLERFVEPDPARMNGPNGITASADGRALYVAFVEGIARLDLASRTLAFLPSPRDVSTAGVDGLYAYRGDLIAVQNPGRLERVVRFRLDSSGTAVVAADVLERGREVMEIPTTGAIVGNRFYYIANSQIRRLGDDDRLARPPASPPPRTIVRVLELPPGG